MDNNVPDIGLGVIVAALGIPFGAVLALGVLAGGITFRWGQESSRVGLYFASAFGVLLNVVVLVCAEPIFTSGGRGWLVIVPAVSAGISLAGGLLAKGREHVEDDGNRKVGS